MSNEVAIDRTQFIGGSDIAKIVGVSEWGDAFSLYLEKTGELVRPDIETKVQRRGKILEPAIIELYRDETVEAVAQGNTQTFRTPHPSHYRAQIDAVELIDGQRQAIPLEIKSASEFTRGKWGKSGTDDAPTSYCAQLHWQMIAMDAPFGRIVALLGADDLRVYTIERDPAVDELLLTRAAEFWTRVQERRPPEIDFHHPSTGETLARLFNNPRATEILQASAELRSWRAVLEQAQENVKTYTGVVEGAKAHLLAAMGNAGAIDYGDQLFVRKVVKRKAYQVEASEYIATRFVNSKAGALPALTQEIAA